MLAKPRMLIGICTYGAYEYARMAALSALMHTELAEPHILIVDDASPDWDHKWLDDLITAYPLRVRLHKFKKNGGLLRSWNEVLGTAGVDDAYVVIANSDVVFAPGWDIEILKALEHYSLVGPVTNAPGTEEAQYVARYSTKYDRDHIEDGLKTVQEDLLLNRAGQVIETRINGFCLIAKKNTWYATRYHPNYFFRPHNYFTSHGGRNPTPTMTLGEYELQARLRALGLKTGIALGSYVVHYRSVSRGVKYNRGDWFRQKPHVNDPDPVRPK